MTTAENETETLGNETDTLTADEIAALIGDAPAECPEAFVPTDAAGVDWVLRKMAAARAEAALIRENAEAMARACERDAEHLEWKYGAAMQTWLRAQLDGTRDRSKRLLHGVLGYRTKPASVTVTDPAAALSWASEHLPGAVVPKLDKEALAKQLLSTGEANDWATLNPAEDVFYIKQK